MHSFIHRAFLPLSRILRIGLSLLVALSFEAASSVPVTLAQPPNLPLVQTLPRFVDEGGQPLANASLRILCYAQADATTPTTDVLFATDGIGQIRQPLPAPCPFLAALQRIYGQPSGKPSRGDAYTVYNTSWEPGTRNLVAATGTITLRSDWRLVLFDVAVALEWEPASTSTYVDDVRQSLQLASAYLYDLTNGQMAFGVVTITTGGHNWAGADIRIRAANDYRPSAQVGGIVAASTTYTAPNGVATVFAPGSITLGRYWDGDNASDPATGRWTEPAAYRTLVHEWLHYALFLYDEYQTVSATGRQEHYCTCDDLPQVGQTLNACNGISADLAASAMAYHYTASELWLNETTPQCQTTEQYQVQGDSDWGTLARWGTIQGVAQPWLHKPDHLASGPAIGSAGDLFDRTSTEISYTHLYLPFLQGDFRNSTAQRSVPVATFAPSIATATAITLNVTLSAALSLPALNALQAQIYTLEPATAAQPARLLYQGTTSGPRQAPNQLGQATLLGIQPGTQLWVFVDGPPLAMASHTAYVYTGTLDPSLPSQTVQAQVDPWRASLDVTPGMDSTRLTKLHVTLASANPLPVAPTVQLCTPDAATGCAADSAWFKTMVTSGDNLTWTATLTMPTTMPTGIETLDLGTLRIHAPGTGDLIRWFQTLGGVGPAHKRASAPTRDGVVAVDTSGAAPDGQSLVFVMPLANPSALDAPLPPGFAGGLDQPLDVKVVTPGVTQPAAGPLPFPTIFTFFVNPPAGATVGAATTHAASAPLLAKADAAGQAQLLHFQPATKQWEVVQFSGKSTSLKWIATQPITETGVYVVGQTASNEFGKGVQIFTDLGLRPLAQPIRYLVVMSAAPNLLTPTAAFIKTLALPLPIKYAENVHCNVGQCSYRQAGRTLNWEGTLAPGDVVFLSYALKLDPAFKPPQLPYELTYTMAAFDGAFTYALSSSIVITAPTGVHLVESR